jgi:hypothetical protein
LINSISEQSVNFRSKYDPENEYCGSIDNVTAEITSQLKEFSQELQSDLEKKLNEDSLYYQNKIDTIKDDMKQKALKVFGNAMYKFLSLQDEYHHFADSFNKIDVTAVINEIQQALAELHPNLLTLKAAVNKYGQYCKTCDTQTISRVSTREYSFILYALYIHTTHALSPKG